MSTLFESSGPTTEVLEKQRPLASGCRQDERRLLLGKLCAFRLVNARHDMHHGSSMEMLHIIETGFIGRIHTLHDPKATGTLGTAVVSGEFEDQVVHGVFHQPSQ